MADRGRELTHGGDAVGVRELHLHLAEGLFGALTLGQIEHERHTLISLFVERDRTDQNRHTATVLAEVLFLVWLRGADLFHLFSRLYVGVAPFGGRQVRPAYAPQYEILTVVSHHAEERVICLNDPTFEIKDKDADDVGVDQAPDFRLAFRDVAVQTSVLQCDRRL